MLMEQFHHEIANQQMLSLSDETAIGTRAVIADAVVARGPYSLHQDQATAFLGQDSGVDKAALTWKQRLHLLGPDFQEFCDGFVGRGFADDHSDVGCLFHRLVNRCWILAFHSAPPCSIPAFKILSAAAKIF